MGTKGLIISIFVGVLIIVLATYAVRHLDNKLDTKTPCGCQDH